MKLEEKTKCRTLDAATARRLVWVCAKRLLINPEKFLKRHE
jgi:hypothetical protein